LCNDSNIFYEDKNYIARDSREVEEGFEEPTELVYVSIQDITANSYDVCFDQASLYYIL